jgi:antitoxin component of MazEF toxin-antitoxin module
MGVRKQGQENIRKLTKLGNRSLAVTLPVEITEKLKLREKQRVVVKRKGKKIIVSDFHPSLKRKKK